jgi:hypothetical protein
MLALSLSALLLLLRSSLDVSRLHLFLVLYVIMACVRHTASLIDGAEKEIAARA